MGAVETMMINAAHVQIGKYLRLPTHSYMGLSDAKGVDGQAGLETGMGALVAALAGANVISGPGMLNFESCQSLEKLVLDNEICGMALRMVRVSKPGEIDWVAICTGIFTMVHIFLLRKRRCGGFVRNCIRPVR